MTSSTLIPKEFRGLLRDIAITLVLLSTLSYFTFQTAVSVSRLVFVNRISDKEVVALSYTKSGVTFASADLIDNISGQRVFSLNLSSETQTYHLYSESFTSSDAKDVSIAKLNGREFPVIWLANVSNGKELIISGKIVDFYKIGTREIVPVLAVKDFHEPGFLDEMFSTNKLVAFQIMIALTVLTVTFVLALAGVFVVLVAAIDTMRESKKPVRRRK